MHRFILILLLLAGLTVQAQEDDLMSMLDVDDTPKEVTGSFKATRLVTGHTTRTLGKNTLDFVINHRFGAVNSGVDEFWGLDDAQIRLGLEYGITDRLMIGAGRSSFEKTVDGYVKYKVLVQKKNGLPITLTAFSSIAIKTGPNAFTDPDYDNQFSQRLAYTYQFLVARKFNSKLSVQVMPTLVHRNIVATRDEPNELVAVGVGGRYKLTQRASINVEYYPQLNNTAEYKDALSLGFDVETGGHVFQVHVTNSRAMIEKAFIGETQGNWSDGDLYFGFNISRSFALGSKKHKEW